MGFRRAIGRARGNSPGAPPGAATVPATPDTLFCLFSASKLVTAMLIHLLAHPDRILRSCARPGQPGRRLACCALTAGFVLAEVIRRVAAGWASGTASTTPRFWT